MTMTFQQAVEYLSPHSLTSDTATVSLTAGKMREAIAAITALIPAIEMATALLEEPKTHVFGQGEVLIFAGLLKSGEVGIRLRNEKHGLPIGDFSVLPRDTDPVEPSDTLLVLPNRKALEAFQAMLDMANRCFEDRDTSGSIGRLAFKVELPEPPADEG